MKGAAHRPEGGYIIGTSDSIVEQPPENFRAFLEVARRHGARGKAE